jgi:hypothetical protein
LASFDGLRRFGKRPVSPGRFRLPGPVLVTASAAALASLLLLAQLAGRPESQAEAARSFLTNALGAPHASASLVRKPERSVSLRVDGNRVEFARAGSTVGLALEGASGTWRRHLRGASRPAVFGQEAIVFRGAHGLEHFSRVDTRQGTRTWRWKLDAAGLTPRLADDGGVDFFRVDRRVESSAGMRIEPAAIFDETRRDVSPQGLRWTLARAQSGWTLALRFDDADLPLPYVIDPNIARTGVNTAVSNGGVTSIAPTKPGGSGTILVAQVAIRNNATINAPAGWNPIGSQQNSGTGLTQRSFWATWTAGLTTSFSWTGSVHAAAAIGSYSDVHPTAPIDASSSGSGTGTTATAPAVTTNFANSMLIPLYSVRGNSTATQNGGQSVTQHYSVVTSGNPGGNRVRITGADGLQASAGGSGGKTATTSNNAWAAHLVALRREPPDGLGTMSPGPSAVAASSTGNTIVWTYTAPADGLVNGEVRLTVPAGWSAPSATTSAAGYTQVSAGALSFSSQTIIVSGLTLSGSASFTITYGSTASGGPGATASATTGTVTWTTQQKGTVGGTLTALAPAPSITQNAPNGSGTLATSTTNAVAKSNGNTITFTYTAAAGGTTNGSISVDVPTGWSAPSVTGTAAGYTTSTAGIVGVAGQTITVSGVTLAAGATVDVVYGATASGGPGATATPSDGAQTWQGKQRSTAAGALVDLAASPSIMVDPADGSGSISPAPATVGYGSTGNTLTFTYTADNTTTDGAVSIDVPAGWSAPSTTGTAAGFATSSAGSLAAAGQTITVTGLSLANGGTFDVVYGATSGGGSGATAPASAGAQTWQAKQRSTAAGTLTDLASSPSITVAAQPSPPSALATTPTSPANDTTPELTGSAPAGSTVKIYASADCIGSLASSGTAAAFGGVGITVALTDNATTSLSATATDPLGGVSVCSSSIDYTADSLDPAAPSGLTTAPASPANDNDPRVNGNAEAGSTVTLYATSDCTGASVSGTAVAFGGAGLDPANVGDNSSTSYTATATDAAGNTSVCSAPVTYVEDSTDPTSSVAFPAAGGFYRAATWSDPSGTAADAGGAGLLRVEISLRRVSTGLYWDGGAFADASENWRTAAGTASWSLAFPAASFPADGDYVVRVRSVDAASNTEAATSYTLTYDTAAPDTTIDTSPADPSNVTAPSFAFSSSEGGSTFECRLDGGSWGACTSPKSYAGLSEGAHTFDVRATDAAGNTDASPAGYGWTIDTAAPETTITAQPADPTNSNDPTFSFSSSESGSSFECRIDGGSWSACTSPEAYTDLADGPRTFDVRATDPADNTDPTPASYGWTIDTGAPSSVASFPVNLGSYNTAGWNAGCSPSGICGTASDDGVGLDRVEVSVQRAAGGQYWDGSAFASASEDWQTAAGTTAWELELAAASFPADGSYTIRVRAYDAAGNVEAPSGRTFTVDTSAPDTQIDSGPPDPTNDQDPSFTFSADQPGSTFDCRLDGGSWAACTSPEAFTGLSAGPHTFDVRATDPAGNVDPSPASETWTIDLAAPSSTIAFPAASGSYNADGWGDPSGTASDAVALDRVEVSLRKVSSGLYWDGTDFADGSENWRSAAGAASWSLAFLAAGFPADGDYAIRVRALDAAGNVEAPSSRTFTVDTVAPETTIDSGPSGPTNSTGASFAFSADQPGSTFECRIDGGSWSACTSPRDHTGLSQGSHTFEVQATDAGGNTDATPASRTWVVDTVPPSASLTAPASGTYVGATVSLTASTSDAGGTGIATEVFEKSAAGAGSWSPVPASWVTAPADDGLYDLRVVATDNAGNVTTSTPATNVRVDNTPPDAVMDSPGPAVRGSVALTHSSTDGGSGIEPTSVQFEYRELPAGPWTPTAASWDTSALAEGQYELRVSVEDRAGNAASSPPETTIVDNTPPTVDFTVPTDLGYVNALSADPLTLVADAADEGSGVDDVEFFVCADPACSSATSLGSDSSGPYEATWPLPGSDGPVMLKALARDVAGHETEVVIAVTVDRTVPDTDLLTNPGNPSNDSSPEFTFSSTEPDSTFECRVDAGLWSACATPHTTAPLADGTHTFEVRAIDVAGNVDASPAAWTWLVDTTAPTATMDDPGDNLRLLVNLTSSQDDPGGAAASGIASVQFEYSVADADTWVATPSAWNTPTVTDGLYDLRVVVTDVAGNVTQSAPVENRRVDNSPPATGMNDPGANLRAVVTLAGSASDAGSGVQEVTFEISPDGGAWSTVGMDNAEPFESSFDTATMPDGLYFFRTVATDVAGNVATSAAVGPRRIDNTLPTATMNDPGANLRGTVNLSSVTDDPPGPPVASGISSVVYEALVGGTWTGISQTWVTPSVPDGVYDLRVVVADVAGNQTISNVVAGRRVDNTAPSTGHNAPGNWQSGGVTVSLSPSDGGSGIANTQYSVDGGGWNSGTTVNVSGDGIHTISFFSTDVAGNIESPQTATVMIDSTPPDPGASDPGNYLRGTVNLSASPDTGGEGAEVTEVEFQHKRSSDPTWTTIAVDTTDTDNPPYTATWATTPAEDGSWDLRFIVRDEAGNESIADLPTKIVDNTAPTGSLASPLGGSTVSGSVTLGVSASDANPIASVEYFVGGGSVGSSSSAPFQQGWNSASGGDGSVSIYAVISDMAGNSTTTASVNVTVDNFAPTVTLSALAPNVSGSVGLSAGASGDTTQVTFERRPAGGGGWTTIGTSLGAPWSASFDTTAVADGNYELRAIAVDAGANSGTSNVVTTRVDNTSPTGLLTQPGDGAIVGGTVALSATASDPASGSGVAGVAWQARTGGGGFADVATATSAPYSATWNVGGLPSGAYDLQLVVTDAAGNTFTSAFITVDVDATPPGVTFDDPGSSLSGTVSLTASTTGDPTSVTFARSPAGAASWTTIGSDGTTPYGVSFDTTSVSDGLYDLRAVVTDAVGNTNESVSAGVRIDNFLPIIVSSVPSNGSIVASATQITITSTEDIASLTALELDGAPAVAPTISGKTATFNTGALAEGSHTLTGTVQDAAGKSSSFSISFLIGVPVPPPSTGGGSFSEVLPIVPAPSNFRGTIEADGSLTLRWTPATNADGEPYPTVLYVDDFATQSFQPGDGEVNLGAFDAADMRTFSISSTDDEGHVSPMTARLRSTTLLTGRSLDEAAAILANRGFELGAVSGTGTAVVAPRAALLAELGAKIDLELGQPGDAPQTRLVFKVVGTKKHSPATRKFIALRLQTTRASQVTAALLTPRGERVYRWRFAVKAGTVIKRLTMPPQVRKPGKYRLVFTVQSSRDSVKKTIVVEIMPKKLPKQVKPNRRPVEVVLTGGSSMRRDIAASVGKGLRVTAALDEDTWTLTGSTSRNVQVVLVDVDRFGLELVRDLRLVFPSIRILALTNDPRRLAQSIRAGATLAVPRWTPPKDIAKLLLQLAKRPAR